MLPFPLHVSQVTVWNFENGNVHYYQQILKYREYAKIMATACAAQSMLMWWWVAIQWLLYHHMPILSLMLTKELLPKHTTLCYSNHGPVARTQLISPQSNAPNGHSQGISTGNYTVWKKKQKTKSRQNPCAPGPHLDTPSCWQRARLPIPPWWLEHDSAQRASQRVRSSSLSSSWDQRNILR